MGKIPHFPKPHLLDIIVHGHLRGGPNKEVLKHEKKDFSTS